MKNKQKTNVQFIKEMMEQSAVGGLKEAFIIEAVHNYSRQVINDPTDWGNSFISKAAWQVCAKECLTAIDGRNA
jgi:hypothetical protein